MVRSRTAVTRSHDSLKFFEPGQRVNRWVVINFAERKIPMPQQLESCLRQGEDDPEFAANGSRVCPKDSDGRYKKGAVALRSGGWRCSAPSLVAMMALLGAGLW